MVTPARPWYLSPRGIPDVLTPEQSAELERVALAMHVEPVTGYAPPTWDELRDQWAAFVAEWDAGMAWNDAHMAPLAADRSGPRRSRSC